MSWIQAGWLAFGVLIGFAHAGDIWRSARRPTASTALSGFGRLLVVGLAFVLAAFFGGIVPTAAGWAAGFLVRVGVGMSRASRIDDNRRRVTS